MKKEIARRRRGGVKKSCGGRQGGLGRNRGMKTEERGEIKRQWKGRNYGRVTQTDSKQHVQKCSMEVLTKNREFKGLQWNPSIRTPLK